MGFVLLFVEGLAAVWLLAAAVTAGAGRLRPWWVQIALGLLALSLPAYTFVAMLGALREARDAPNWGTGATGLAVWIGLANAGVVAVVVAGLWRRGQTRQPWARAWPGVKLAAAGGAAALLVVVTLWTMSNALMARVAALRAEAGTLALAAAPARLPDHENAARLYEAAAEFLRAAPGDDEKLDKWQAADRLEPDDPDRKAYLTRRGAALELIKQATALPGCRFDVPPSGSAAVPEGVNHVRGAAAVVALQVRDAAARGGTFMNVATDRLGGLFRMSQHVAANPDVNAILAAAAIEVRALVVLDQTFASSPAGFSVMAGPALFRTDLRRALQAEEALVYARLAGIVEQAAGFGLVFLDDDLAAFHALFRRMGEELAKPYPECLRGWEGLEAEFTAIPGVLYRLALPAYKRLLPAVARADASRRVALLAGAVDAYREVEKKFPEKVEDVAPMYIRQVPPDPFTGQLLKMKATGDGVVVYSVGPDGVDDGGAPLSNEQPPKGDIRVRIGRKK